MAAGAVANVGLLATRTEPVVRRALLTVLLALGLSAAAAAAGQALGAGDDLAGLLASIALTGLVWLGLTVLLMREPASDVWGLLRPYVRRLRPLAPVLLVAVAAGAAVLALSGGEEEGPQTPPGIEGRADPFLGVAVVGGGGGLAGAVDAYGTVVDLRLPGPAGESQISIPHRRQEAGTVSPRTGLTLAFADDGDAPEPAWESESAGAALCARVRTSCGPSFGATEPRLLVTDAARGPVLARRLLLTGDGKLRLRLIADLDLAGNPGGDGLRQVPGGFLALDGSRVAGCEAEPPPHVALDSAHDPYAALTWRAEDRLRVELTCAFGRGQAPEAGAGRCRRRRGRPPLARGRARDSGPARPAGHARSTTARCWCCGRSPTRARARWPPACARPGPTSGRGTRGPPRSRFAETGHAEEARAIARFLSSLDLAEGARFGGDGTVVGDGRPAQGDAGGWTRLAREAAGLPPAAATGPGWRGRPDYGERTRRRRRLHRERDRRRRRKPAPAQAVQGTPRPARAASRRPTAELDSATAWAVRPFPAPGARGLGRGDPARRRQDRRAATASSPARAGPGTELWTAPAAWMALGEAGLGHRGPALAPPRPPAPRRHRRRAAARTRRWRKRPAGLHYAARLVACLRRARIARALAADTVSVMRRPLRLCLLVAAIALLPGCGSDPSPGDAEPRRARSTPRAEAVRFFGAGTRAVVLLRSDMPRPAAELAAVAGALPRSRARCDEQRRAILAAGGHRPRRAAAPGPQRGGRGARYRAGGWLRAGPARGSCLVLPTDRPEDLEELLAAAAADGALRRAGEYDDATLYRAPGVAFAARDGVLVAARSLPDLRRALAIRDGEDSRQLDDGDGLRRPRGRADPRTHPYLRAAGRAVRGRRRAAGCEGGAEVRIAADVPEGDADEDEGPHRVTVEPDGPRDPVRSARPGCRPTVAARSRRVGPARRRRLRRRRPLHRDLHRRGSLSPQASRAVVTASRGASSPRPRPAHPPSSPCPRRVQLSSAATVRPSRRAKAISASVPHSPPIAITASPEATTARLRAWPIAGGDDVGAVLVRVARPSRRAGCRSRSRPPPRRPRRGRLHHPAEPAADHHRPGLREPPADLLGERPGSDPSLAGSGADHRDLRGRVMPRSTRRVLAASHPSARARRPCAAGSLRLPHLGLCTQEGQPRLARALGDQPRGVAEQALELARSRAR